MVNEFHWRQSVYVRLAYLFLCRCRMLRVLVEGNVIRQKCRLARPASRFCSRCIVYALVCRWVLWILRTGNCCAVDGFTTRGHKKRHERGGRTDICALLDAPDPYNQADSQESIPPLNKHLASQVGCYNVVSQHQGHFTRQCLYSPHVLLPCRPV